MHLSKNARIIVHSDEQRKLLHEQRAVHHLEVGETVASLCS